MDRVVNDVTNNVALIAVLTTSLNDVTICRRKRMYFGMALGFRSVKEIHQGVVHK